MTDNIFRRQWREIDIDSSYRTYELVVRGRLTRSRYKRIDRWCRKNTKHYRCGHEWDCCGCIVDTICIIKSYTNNNLIIELTVTYNY